MPPFPKAGHLESPTYLAFIRRQPCAFCYCIGPNEAHHFPPRGRGVHDDTMTIAVCMECHGRCHHLTVNGKEPIPEKQQIQAAMEMHSHFFNAATPEEWAAVGEDRKRWIESRVFNEEIPT